METDSHTKTSHFGEIIAKKRIVVRHFLCFISLALILHNNNVIKRDATGILIIITPLFTLIFVHKELQNANSFQLEIIFENLYKRPLLWWQQQQAWQSAF